LAKSLTLTTNIKVTGASEDANRMVEYRGLMYDADGTPSTVHVEATDLVMDRLPASAQVQFGLLWAPVAKLTLRAMVYDAFVAHTYHPDAFFDYEPHLEFLPNPNEGFRAYLSAMYQY
ncbi:MAG: hypothetical protein H0T79_14985, partial [Deltaproteobacteria bacterium]|nr:hypothetical protein [Deltaproteobacteria bacterium]